MKKYLYCLYQGIERAINYDGIEHAGYMSFMVLLALFPFLVFFLSLTSFFGAYQLGQNFIEIMIDSSPDYAIGSISSRLEELKRLPPRGLLNLAIFGAIWTASSFVEGLRTILNRVLEVKSPPPYIARRLLSIFQFIILCFCLIMAMLIFVIIPTIVSVFNFSSLGYQKDMWGYYKDIYIFISLFCCVLGFYTFIPNAKISWVRMIPGAAFTTMSWQICGRFVSNYLSYYHQLSIVYGSLGNIIITLLFFYVVNFIFIVGAAYNYHLSIYEKRS
ncbi:MAG: YihY/virulence factor BrkB family protein [Rickettsiaceae bacterium]|nr:YihY/virulence factor BrkB family protein [Rickettsiaceae bacterium]